jgi:hypothetical protein
VKILDRYLVREIVPPLLMALLGLTFVLMMPPILQNAERLIAKGVSWSIIFRALLTLTPQALSVTIPMALLFGVLFGLGRLSADREFVALQACGVSIFRLMRPVALLAVVATAATAYETIVALPDANQTYRELTFNAVAAGAESDIKPRVFFTNFPNRVLYVRDIPPSGGWRDIFLADATQQDRRPSTWPGRAGSRSIAPSARWNWCSRTAPCTRPIPTGPRPTTGTPSTARCSTWTPRRCFRGRKSSRATTRNRLPNCARPRPRMPRTARSTTASSTPSSRSSRCPPPASCSG